MKSRWMLLLGCALVVACQKPQSQARIPAASGGDQPAVTKDSQPAAPAASGGEVAVAEPAKETAEPAVPAVPAVDPKVRIPEIVNAYRTQLEAFNKKMQEASPADRRALAAERPNVAETVGQVKELLEATTDPATRSTGLLFLAQYTMRQPGHAEVVTELVEKHSDSAELAPLVMNLGRMLPNGKEVLEKLVAGNGHSDVKAVATFALANMIVEEDSAKAEEMLTKVLADHGSVMVGGRSLSEIGGPVLFEMQNLAIGKTVPDIEGTDFENVAFKLSDYRGKVVVLDFWGDW